MIIGCVKEIKNHEYRVGITPENAREYIKRGHKVLIEKGAGKMSGFSDDEYLQNGAKLIESAKEVWDSCEMMIKVKEPLPEEYGFFHEGLILYTYLHLAADREQTEALLDGKIKGVAYETLQEKDGSLPLLIPMSQIAGRLSIQEGAKYLEKTYGGEGILLSGVPGVKKAEVVVLGAGTVGANACRQAIGMGANVTVLDIDMKKLEALDRQFGSSLQTLMSTDSNIEEAVKKADLVIGSVLVPGGSTPKLFKRQYLKEMKEGAVFVDVAIDQGGCGESSHVTTHDDPVFIEEGVVHYCVGNMPGAVPRTSTIALTNATLKYGLMIAEKGLESVAKENRAVYDAVNTYEGKITYKKVADALSMEYTELSALI
ncbi:MAG: alanine dehydrogenase [Clostridia bacterium]|nr:alanine dehydrogenase [Clostridia bacterium]MBQ5957410.1 alanine dehydrogenase [Clostridia bacterium]